MRELSIISVFWSEGPLAKWGCGSAEMGVYVELAKDFETQQEVLLKLLENFDRPFGKMTLELIAWEPAQGWVMQRADILGFFFRSWELWGYGNS